MIKESLINFSESREFSYVVMEIVGRPKSVAEVGTFNPGHLQTLPFVFDRVCRVQLFEPNPSCVDELKRVFKKQPNIEINEVAIGYAYGQADLCVPVYREKCPNASSSAFLEGISSPYMAREAVGRGEAIRHVRVEIAPLSEFDDGGIEAITIDTEGNEWPVLSTMISRPRVISVEMKGPNGYVNPHTEEIEAWMRENSYEARDGGKTDVIYVRSE
jgi:FkbM family methyltransferase